MTKGYTKTRRNKRSIEIKGPKGRIDPASLPNGIERYLESFMNDVRSHGEDTIEAHLIRIKRKELESSGTDIFDLHYGSRNEYFLIRVMHKHYGGYDALDGEHRLALVYHPDIGYPTVVHNTALERDPVFIFERVKLEDVDESIITGYRSSFDTHAIYVSIFEKDPVSKETRETEVAVAYTDSDNPFIGPLAFFAPGGKDHKYQKFVVAKNPNSNALVRTVTSD